MQLQPVFRPTARSPPANACPLNDGAAAVIVIVRLARLNWGDAVGARRRHGGLGASPPRSWVSDRSGHRRVLAQARDDDRRYRPEINEAFAVQVIWLRPQLGIPMEKLNVNGGAIAVGHPSG